ncbi:MAG TPA: hypothetical protein VD886_23315 [Herpetosiphonaceae bacterium]|nr:hypothetical protein [Herpetosiphonaceae bacterium]
MSHRNQTIIIVASIVVMTAAITCAIASHNIAMVYVLAQVWMNNTSNFFKKDGQ